MRVLVIINPYSGADRRLPVPARVALATQLLREAHHEPDVRVTTGADDATRWSREAVAAGVDRVVAWGGDGTVNAVAAALVGSRTALAIVRAGSGNGLARELGIPRDSAAAMRIAAGSVTRLIDAARVNGRWFVNVAGVGFDAEVAHGIARPGARRGLLGYLGLVARLAPGYRPRAYAVSVDGEVLHTRAWLIALANSRQYGHEAIVAPRARLDDGLIDVVAVETPRVWQVVRDLPRLFSGRLQPGGAVIMRQGRIVRIASADGEEMSTHVDGEPMAPCRLIEADVTRGALQVCVPAGR
jgi:YegS/Rv2252/BmrU family lipid kinase